MGLLGSGPDMMAEIGLDARGFLLGARQIETSLTYLSRHPLFLATAITAGLGGVAVSAAMKFEDALVGVAKTMDLTAEQTEEVAAAIRALAKEKPFDTTSIAGVAQVGARLGIAREHLMDFTSTMLDFGAAVEDMSAEDAADLFARFSNVVGEGQDQFGQLASTVVHLGNNLATTEGEILKMSFRMAGAGKLVGMSTDQILGLSGALSALGVRSEMGGSAMSRILKRIHVAVNDTSREGRANLEAFARVAGTSAENFARVWESAPEQALLQFLQGLTDLETAGENIIPVLNELGLSEIRVSDVTLRAKNGHETLRKALGLAAQGWTENTALTREAERRYATTSSQLKLLVNDIRDNAIAFGMDLLPAVNDVIAALREFIKTGGGEMAPLFAAFERLGREVAESVASILGDLGRAFGDSGLGTILLAAAVLSIDALTLAVKLLSAPFEAVAGSAAWFAETLEKVPGLTEAVLVMLGALGVALVAANAGTIAWTIGLGVLNIAMAAITVVETAWNVVLAVTNFLLSPLTLIILGIAAAIGVAILIWKNWDDIVVGFNATLEWLTSAFDSVWTWIRDVAAAVGEFLEPAWQAIVDATQTVADFLKTTWGTTKEFVIGIFSSVSDFLTGTWDAIKETFTLGVTFVKGAWEGLWDWVAGIFSDWYEGVKVTLAAFILTLTGVFTGDLDLIKQAWGAWADKIVEIGASIWSRVKEPFENIVSTIKDFGSHAFDYMVAGFEAGWQAVVSWFSTLSGALVQFLAGLPGSIYNVGVAFIAAIRDGGAAAWNAVSVWFIDRSLDLYNFFVNLPGNLKSIASNAFTSLKTGAETAWNSVKGWFNDLPGVISGAFWNLAGAFWNIGSAIVNGLRDGILGAWATFKNFVGTKVSEVVQWAKDILGVHSPSRVFAGIGENIVQGFEQGIEPLGDLLSGGRIQIDPINFNGADGGRGGPMIGTLHLTVYANDRRGGDEAARALERRLQRLGVMG